MVAMSLAVLGNGASYEFRWRTWALLRDVVVANLDEATLPAFCCLGDALVQPTLQVDAHALASDVARIRAWLVGRSFEELVLGPRTSAILHFTNKPTERRAMARAEVERIRPIAGSQDLAEYFGVILDSLERVCAHPNTDGTLEVVDA
jgi:hypothetical protein